jgi:transposase
MSDTPNTSQKPIPSTQKGSLAEPPDPAGPEFLAFVGLDWGDKKHAWALQAEGSTKLEKGEIRHTPEAIEEWVAQLGRRFPNGRIAVALEQSRGPLVFALTKYEQLTLFPIHPNSAADYRRIFRPSGAKSDGPDASMHLDMLLRHRDKLRPLTTDTVETRTLQFLVEDRRQLVDQRTRLVQRLVADLKAYYPQVLEWFEHVYALVTLDFLDRWPSVEELQKTKAATLTRFLKEHQCRDEVKNQQRIEAMQKAVAATHDRAVTQAGRCAVRAAVRLLRDLNQSIQEYDLEIEALAKAHPDFPIFDSLPGAGAALAPRLIAAFGTQRDRWQSAAELQRYSGIAPVTESSGNQHWVHWRWSCPKFLRQSFHEWAAQSISHCDWAAAYYQVQREEKKKSHHAAVRSLAYKWIRIAFRCWKDGKPYDDSHYEASLTRRKKTTPQPTNPSPFDLPIQWTSCGSFQKVALKTAK